VNHTDGDPALGDFSYNSVVGMIMYLAGHTRPDIAYAIDCCARYMFCPKRSRKLALKRIDQYLKATHDHGLVLNPSRELKIECYLVMDFAGSMDMRTQSIHPALRAELVHFQSWRQKSLLWLTVVKNIFPL
jgi:hypothetical protein